MKKLLFIAATIFLLPFIGMKGTPAGNPSASKAPSPSENINSQAVYQPHYISPTPGKFPIIASSPVSDNRIPTRAEEIDYDYTADGLYYKILGDSEKCVEVVNGNRETVPETIIIPPIVKIDGREYTVIGLGHRALVNCRNSRYLLLPPTLKYIENSACLGYYEYVGLPESLETVGSWAFYCTCLNSIIIPDNVNRLEDFAFGSCYTVHTMVLGRGIKTLGHSIISPEVWNIREQWQNDSQLKDLYVLAPEPPEFDYDAKPFCNMSNVEDITVYIPDGSLEKYTAYREPVYLDHPDWPYDTHGWQWWTYFKNFKTIPDLFIVNGIPYEVSL